MDVGISGDKSEIRMTNDESNQKPEILDDESMTNNKMTEIISEKTKTYDLEERTAKFAEKVVLFIKRLPSDSRFIDIIRQLIRAATSVGANYCEADDAHSKKDFHHKIAICKKESRETKYWLRVIAKIYPTYKDGAIVLSREAQELNLIFGAINRKK